MPMVTKATPYEKFLAHARRWRDCDRCLLACQRQHIVLARGQVPCDILFIGEAPGDSEDSTGEPFRGPAGKLLDRIIHDAVVTQPQGDQLRLAFTNLVCCFPREQKRNKINEPPIEAIKACQPRLQEFVQLAEPRMIVRVGELAAAHCGQLNLAPVKMLDIVHPAAILRANDAHQRSMRDRAVVALANAIENLVG